MACKLYGWKDLNEENDNYSTGTPIDCYDLKTKLYHQVQGRYYNFRNGLWSFAFENEWGKMFEDVVCFCFSKDGKLVERIYKFPWKEIKTKKGISIVKYDSKGDVYNNGWYEKYRITDVEELDKANEIWTQICSGKC